MASYIFYVLITFWTYCTVRTVLDIAPFNSLLASFAITLGVAVIFQHHSESSLDKINEDILALEYKCKTPIEITNTLLSDLEKIKYEYKLEVQQLKLDINELSMLNLNDRILDQTSNTELFNSETFYFLIGVSLLTIVCLGFGYLYLTNNNINLMTVNSQNIEAVPVYDSNIEQQILTLREHIELVLQNQESIEATNLILNEIVSDVTLELLQEIAIYTPALEQILIQTGPTFV